MAKSKKEILKMKAKLDSLQTTFISMDNDKGRLGLNLLREAMFLNETLEQLKDEINAEGVVTEMCQGTYSIKRENPALKSYNVSLKGFQSLIKQMSDLISKDSVKIEDEFDDFNK